MENEKDKALWKAAKQRVGFKRHLYTYLIVNLFLWVLWFMGSNEEHRHGLPWPAWSTLGWGIGLFFNYASVYLFNETNAIEKEYNKLKDKS